MKKTCNIVLATLASTFCLSAMAFNIRLCTPNTNSTNPQDFCPPAQFWGTHGPELAIEYSDNNGDPDDNYDKHPKFKNNPDRFNDLSQEYSEDYTTGL